MNDLREQIRAAAAKCTYCGACQAVCPVYGQTRQDHASARGRLLQLCFWAEGRIPASRALADALAGCTLCMACEKNCAAGIETTRLFMQFRKLVADTTPLPLVKRVAFTGLTYRRLFEACLSLGPLGQKLLFKPADDGPGCRSRLPIPAAGLNKRRLVPSLATRPLRRLVPRVSRPRLAKAKVALFPGCMLNYVYPEAGKAVVDVLTRNGVQVVLPERLSCCGTPALASGDFASSGALARNNVSVLRQLADVDAVITACATCATALGKEYGMLLEGEALSHWESLKGKVRDFSDFLVDFGFSDAFSARKLSVTYHDPCHLARGMNVSAQPRRLIQSIPGVTFKEMKDAARCCGCAGTFSATHYDLSVKINDDKVRAARDTGAELLATGCSACRMHIADGLARGGARMDVLHTAQLLAMAYGM